MVLRRFAVFALFVSLALPATAATGSPAVKHAASRAAKAQKVKIAPADEYFGRMKMSILGIRNSLRDVTQRAEWYPERAGGVLREAALTEDAMHDWQRKYPRDGWLPRGVYLLQHLYTKVQTDDGRLKAITTTHWLLADFPKTWFAKQLKIEIARANAPTHHTSLAEAAVVPPTVEVKAAPLPDAQKAAPSAPHAP
jgi:hypothetical protein